MKRKNIYFYLLIICGFLNFGLISCTDYLDKSPSAGLSQEDVFKSFNTYQGFIEDAYDCMADPMNTASSSLFNFGDDILQPRAEFLGSINSDYRRWEQSPECIFYSNLSGDLAVPSKFLSNPFSGSQGGYGDGTSTVSYWDGGWLGIRKVNIALENLDKMTIPYKSAPLQEQKDLIQGQALFLRGYLHFHIIRVWGGMPYITKAFTPTDNLKLTRLSYAASSDSIEKDLLLAADKLPVSWDATETGKISEGTNEGRFTKGAAYALLGKVMLYAGSPLMNGASNGPGGYVYNKDYCKKAVRYFWEVIKLSTLGGGSTYDLLPWANYSENFYAFVGKIPASGKEGILNTRMIAHQRSHQIGDMLTSMGGWGIGCGPLENYVQYFGMNDGTNFNPNIYNTPTIDPWANRDPRFYKNIVCDRQTLMKTKPVATPAQFFLGGRDCGAGGKSETGYGWQKYRDSTIWVSGGTYNWSNSLNRRLPVIRLADVYLMYAEAVNEAYGANVDPSTVDAALADCHIKAWQAVKAVRGRVLNPDGTPLPLPSSLYSSDNAMRETIRRERAVELAFEGHRWYDLRRWYVSDQPEYMKLDVLDFDKDHTYFKVRSYGKKVFEKKHFWMPLLDAQVQIFEGFNQNPGW